MFHVTTDEDVLGGIDASDFDDRLDALGADYAENYQSTDAARVTGELKSRFLAARFRVQDKTGELPIGCAFAFGTGSRDELKQAQIAWFRESIDALKSKVAGMSDEDFACDTAMPYALKELVDDRYGDAVYLDMGTGPAVNTLDRFMRCLQPGTTYFVDAAAVYLH